MRNGIGAGLGIGLVVLICGSTAFMMYKVIGGASPAPALADAASEPSVGTESSKATVGNTRTGKLADAAVRALEKAAPSEPEEVSYPRRPYVKSVPRGRPLAPRIDREVPEITEFDRKLVILERQIGIFRARAMRYAWQHRGKYPDFKQRGWEQLIKPTDEDGNIVAAGTAGALGPYLDEPIRNAVNGKADIYVIPRGEARIRIDGKDCGWAFAPDTQKHWQKLWATGHDPQHVILNDHPWPPDRALNRATKLAALNSQVNSLREIVELYKLQHNGQVPSFDGHFAWEVFVGPYLSKTPTNRLNREWFVEMLDSDPVPGQKARFGEIGYVANKKTGKLWAVDENGVVVLDE